MEDILVPFALFATIAYAIVGTTRAIADSRTRRRLIEAKATPEVVRAMVTPLAGDRERYPSLRSGLVLGLVGLALLLVRLLPRPVDDTVSSAVVLLAGGVALLAHHVLARRLARGATPPALLAAAAPATAPPTDAPSVPAVADLELGRPA